MCRVWLLLTVCALAAAEPVNLHRGNHQEGEKDQHNKQYRLVDPSQGQQPHAHDPHIERENEIINDVLGPVYYQPQILLDYRYLKTHRSYVEGAGGQDLILPKSIHDPHHPFDHLLEELRKKELKREGHKEVGREELREERREDRREEGSNDRREEAHQKPRVHWPMPMHRERNEWKY